MWKDKKVCPKCFSENTIKKGKQKKTGKQNYLCKDCGRHFTDEYSNNGFKRDYSSRINIELSKNSVRKTAKILKLSPTTVMNNRNKVLPDFRFPVLDLFSGIGGFSLGLERTGGFRTVAFCEIDQKARNVLNKHWPDVVKYKDVRNITLERLEKDGIERPEIICGGFPCQDISAAGKQSGIDGERSGLWAEYKRLISEIRPRYAIVENVRNLLSGQRGAWFGRLLGDLAEIGYDAEWNVISAAKVGARHLRERVWIVAYPRMHRRGGDIPGGLGRISAAEKQKIRSSAPNEITGPSQGQEIVADSQSERSEKWITGSSKIFSNSNSERLENGISKTTRQQTVTKPERLRSALPDTNKFYDDNRRYGTSQTPLIKETDIQKSEFWSIEPEVGRVVNGVPGRVDRLRQLGNAVVPQIPELIGNAILNREEHEKQRNNRTTT